MSTRTTTYFLHIYLSVCLSYFVENVLVIMHTWAKADIKSPTLPASLIGPLSMLPPMPGSLHNGGAHCASQWQFFLLLHTCKSDGCLLHYTLHLLILIAFRNEQKINTSCNRCNPKSSNTRWTSLYLYFLYFYHIKVWNLNVFYWYFMWQIKTK